MIGQDSKLMLSDEEMEQFNNLKAISILVFKIPLTKKQFELVAREFEDMKNRGEHICFSSTSWLKRDTS